MTELTELNGPSSGFAVLPDAPHWFAAYTCARHEKRVAEQLVRRHVECFLPLYNAMHRWKDRRMQVQVPLIPGYVFVHIPVRERLQVLEVPSVVHLVSVSGKPVPLPDGDIEALRRGLATRAAEPHPYLAVGRRVRIKSGPFEGLEGILKRKKDNFRLVVSIDLIMRSVLLDINGGEVEPVNEHHRSVGAALS